MKNKSVYDPHKMYDRILSSTQFPSNLIDFIMLIRFLFEIEFHFVNAVGLWSKWNLNSAIPHPIECQITNNDLRQV